MPVRCKDIYKKIEEFAPKYLAENWDNVGLIIGNPEREVRRVLVVLDVSERVVNDAIENNMDMIISHHPLIFKGLNHIRTDLPTGSAIAALLRKDIAVYVAHTNLDLANGGVNDVLGGTLALQNLQPLIPSVVEKFVKLAVFVPESHLHEVREALVSSGAGHVGNYSSCTFSSIGIGSFLPLPGTNPYIGEPGKMEYVSEYRLETIIPEELSHHVIQAMLQVHPYEEVAYDVYPLKNNVGRVGLGRIGELTTTMTLAEFAACVKKALNVDCVRTNGFLQKKIRRVAICGGSGSSMINKAISAGADVFVTGDIKYHEALDAASSGLALIDAGHFGTEYPVVPYVAEFLRKWAEERGKTLEVCIDTGTDVFSFC